jgi:hypothetical protein
MFARHAVPSYAKPFAWQHPWMEVHHAFDKLSGKSASDTGVAFEKLPPEP